MALWTTQMILFKIWKIPSKSLLQINFHNPQIGISTKIEVYIPHIYENFLMFTRNGD